MIQNHHMPTHASYIFPATLFLLYIEHMILRKTGNANEKIHNIVSSVMRYHSPLYELRLITNG